jgi:hypothetical protein
MGRGQSLPGVARVRAATSLLELNMVMGRVWWIKLVHLERVAIGIVLMSDAPRTGAR